MYVTAQEVYDATELTTTEISESSVNSFIKSAEKEVDRLTFTTYWAKQLSKTISSATVDSITVDSETWTTDEYSEMYLWIYSGTGVDQIRKIESNDDDTLTVEDNFETIPVSGDKIRIIYTATDPHFNELRDGNDIDTYFLPEYPIRLLNSVSIDDVSITLTNLYIYDKLGKLILKRNAEQRIWMNLYPQQISLNYWFGVFPVPYEIKRCVVVLSALKALSAQMGGTYDTPSSYRLPEGEVTIGQAYVNIRGTFDVLNKEYANMINNKTLIKYPKVV